MPGPIAQLFHFGFRAASYPWRRARRLAARWRRGHVYARQPRWWPDHLARWPWLRSPHDGKGVVIFDGTTRYEFAPAVWGSYGGHVYAGGMRPTAAEIASTLTRLALDPSAARVLAAVSAFEGGFDTVQTYDRGKFTWGFIQFTATGGLPRLLMNLKAWHPELFTELFTSSGVDIDNGQIVIQLDGRSSRGRAAYDRLHDDPATWAPFLRASGVPAVQDAQVRTAYEAFYQHPLSLTLALGRRHITLAELFADDEYGRAVVCDRSVNRGVGAMILLFGRSAQHVRARSVADAPAILARVLALEEPDGERLRSLRQTLVVPTPNA